MFLVLIFFSIFILIYIFMAIAIVLTAFIMRFVKMKISMNRFQIDLTDLIKNIFIHCSKRDTSLKKIPCLSGFAG